MMDSALIFATIVQLLGVWRAERQIVGKDDNKWCQRQIVSNIKMGRVFKY